jgi:hypothetical protein
MLNLRKKARKKSCNESGGAWKEIMSIKGLGVGEVLCREHRHRDRGLP